MAKYFFAPQDKTGDIVTLRGETAHHLLNVLRLKPGADVTLCDGACTDYTATLCKPTGGKLLPVDSCTFQITATTPCQTEPSFPITVYQAHPKGDKIESVIQKSVELGAAKIVPLFTAHTLVKNIDKKQPRYQKIAHAAAEQCNRGILPEVAQPMKFKDAVANKPPHIWLVALSPSEVGDAPLSSLVEIAESLHCPVPCENKNRGDSFVFENVKMPPYKPLASLGIWIGPEGGFSPEEVAQLLAAGAHAVSLGPRVLRTETVAPALLAQISLLWESNDFGSLQREPFDKSNDLGSLRHEPFDRGDIIFA